GTLDEGADEGDDSERRSGEIAGPAGVSLTHKRYAYLARLHEHTADHFGAVFRASQDPPAAFASIDHRLRAVHLAVEAGHAYREAVLQSEDVEEAFPEVVTRIESSRACRESTKEVDQARENGRDADEQQGDTALIESRDRPFVVAGMLQIAMLLRASRSALLSRGFTSGACRRIDELVGRLITLRNYFDLEGRRYNHYERWAIGIALRTARDALARLAFEAADARRIRRRLDQAYMPKAKPGKEQEQAALYDIDYPPLPTPPMYLLTPKHERHEVVTRGLADEHTFRQYGNKLSRRLEKAALSLRLRMENLVKQLTGNVADNRLNTSSVGEEPESYACLTEIFTKNVAEIEREDFVQAVSRISFRLSQFGMLENFIRLMRRGMYLAVLQGEVSYVRHRYLKLPTLNQDWDSKDPDNAGAGKQEHRERRLLFRRGMLMFHGAMCAARLLNVETPYSITRRARAENRLRTLHALLLAVDGEHAEARQELNQAQSLLRYSPSVLSSEIIGIMRAEYLLLRIRHYVPDFHDRLKEYLPARRPEEQDKPLKTNPLNDAARRKALGYLMDADIQLDLTEQQTFGTRKSVWWTSRFLFLRIKAEFYRVILLADEGLRPRILETRSTAEQSTPFRLAQTLRMLANVTRTDPFMLARGLHLVRYTLKCLESIADGLPKSFEEAKAKSQKEDRVESWPWPRVASFGRAIRILKDAIDIADKTLAQVLKVQEDLKFEQDTLESRADESVIDFAYAICNSASPPDKQEEPGEERVDSSTSPAATAGN
ncbi:MAG: hypothetical protein AAGK78_01825, partial [Planctomycetota bacterium]